MDADKKVSCKVVLLGNSGVGKTSLVIRWTTGIYEKEIRPTIGANHQRKIVKLGDEDVDLYLWDTAGQEQFQSLTPLYARAAACALIVASISDPDSFTALETWRELLNNSCDHIPPILLIVNKIDLTDQAHMSNEDIQEKYADKFSGVFFVSARTGEGVDPAFMQAAQVGYKFALRWSTTRRQVAPQSGNGRDSCC
jgi:small GTP-binding protein